MEKKQYTVEIIKKECIEQYGKCYVPKLIMRQEKIQSGTIVQIVTSVNEIPYCMIATAWEKKGMTNSSIVLHPCCFKSSNMSFPDKQFLIGSIEVLDSPVDTSIRLTLQTALQTYRTSFNRRMSQFLHRCPLMIGGSLQIGSNKYFIKSSLPNKPVVTCIVDTNILFEHKRDEISSSKPLSTPQLDKLQCPLPGLEKCYTILVTSVLYHRLFQKEIDSYGIRLFKGILISGDHGTGKTSIIDSSIAFCRPYMNMYVQTVTPSSIRNTNFGESAQYIQSIFTSATKFAESNDGNLSIIVIDNIDRICIKRSEYDQENVQIVSQLLTCIDGLHITSHILIIATTTQPYLLDEALRRSGRFDREINLLPPTQVQREEILRKYFSAYGVLQQVEMDIGELSLLTRGFSGADLEMFVRQSILTAVETSLQTYSDSSHVDMPSESITEPLSASLSFWLMLSVLAGITPSVMKDQERVTGISWHQIGGMHDVKTQLQKYVEWPIIHRQQFDRFNLAPPRGILLYGPPGCAKTTLARALASEAHSSFWTLNTSQVFTPYVGESEFIIRSLFARARAATPAIIFLDEIDALVCKRGFSNSDDVVQSRVMATFLTEMDGIENSNGIIILGATNRPEMIDDALMRPGRFDQLIYIPPPDVEAREEIFKVYTSQMCTDDSLDINELAVMTEGYSGADIENICREAVYGALRKNIDVDHITQQDIKNTVKITKPSITSEAVELCNDFQNAFYQS